MDAWHHAILFRQHIVPNDTTVSTKCALYRLPMMKPDPDEHTCNPNSPGPHPSLGSTNQPSPRHQPHMGPDFIGAVHMSGPMTRTATHMGHMGMSCPVKVRNPEGMTPIPGMGGDAGEVMGSYPWGPAFGLMPYADAAALNRLQGHPTWESEVSCPTDGWCVNRGPPYLLLLSTSHIPSS